MKMISMLLAAGLLAAVVGCAVLSDGELMAEHSVAVYAG
jgi:hypothetical protein